MNSPKAVVVVLVFVTVIAASSASAATCSNATVTGVWGFQIGTAVGQFTSDGKGTITAGSQTVNQNGTIVVQTFTGTYSVASNCTGSLTANVSGGGTATASFVLDNSNKGAQIIDTTSGFTNVAQGVGATQGIVTCGVSGKRTFATQLLGKINGATSVGYVAQVVFDGKGGVSGSGTFDTGGTILNAHSITGAYSETSSCTGTIQMTPSGFSTLNFAFVVVNSGKELLLVDTDSNAAVAGYMQQ